MHFSSFLFSDGLGLMTALCRHRRALQPAPSRTHSVLEGGAAELLVPKKVCLFLMLIDVVCLYFINVLEIQTPQSN